MRIVCSWCRGGGQIGLVGEKAPLEDRRETHGICMAHRIAVQARWRVSNQESAGGISVGAASGMSSLVPGRQFLRSATHVWDGLKNLTRKTSL